MERKRYLELCQRNAVTPETKKVLLDGTKYYPDRIEVWFDGSGKTINTAVLKDTKAKRCVVKANLERVEEYEKD